VTNSSNFPNRPFRLEIRTWVNWQDVPSNRDSIHSELWIIKNAYSPSFSNATSSFDHWANGGRVNSGTFTFDFTSTDALRISSTDFLVVHDADGSKTFETAGFVNADVLGYTQVNEWITPPTIPRATIGTFAGGSAFDSGAAVTINLPRASSAFTHVIDAAFGTRRVTIASGVGTSYVWTPDLAWLDQIPNATSGVGEIIVGTYNGSDPNAIGYQRTGFTLRAPASAVPTISAVTVQDNNPDVASKIGKLVQGLSAAIVTVTAAGVYGSTITQKSATVGTVAGAEGTPIPITVSGSVSVVGVATDSRGRTATSAGTIPVLAYDVPKILTAPTAQRCSSGGAPADNGTFLRVDLNASVSSLVNGTEKNALTVTVQTREHGTGPWTNRNVLTPGLAYNGFFVVTGGGIFDVAKSWDVRILVADVFQTAIQDLVVGTERVIADFGPGGMGINKRYTQGGLDVAGDIFTDGELRHRGNFPVEPVGVIHMFAGATAPAGFLICDGSPVSRTTYAALFTAIGTLYGVGNGTSTFNLPDFRGRGAMGKDATTDFDTLGKTGGEKKHTQTVAEMPKHGHSLDMNTAGYTGGAAGNIHFGNGAATHPAYFTGGANSLTGGDTPFNVLDPYVTVNFIIKAQ